MHVLNETCSMQMQVLSRHWMFPSNRKDQKQLREGRHIEK